MIHPDTALRFISEEKGYGVVATKLIPTGTITWAGDPLDQVFTPDEIKHLPEPLQEILDTYTYRDHDGSFILCWDHARFINHSFNSNCISTPYNFELAVRDIFPGEELTDDYGYLNVTKPLYFPAEPGSMRNVVMPDDLIYFHDDWDKKIESAFRYFNYVLQPLDVFIAPKFINCVNLITAGKMKPDSILNCYYDDGHHNAKAA
jgi:hypothetical protein